MPLQFSFVTTTAVPSVIQFRRQTVPWQRTNSWKAARTETHSSGPDDQITKLCGVWNVDGSVLNCQHWSDH